MKKHLVIAAILALGGGATLNLNAQTTNSDESKPTDQTLQRALSVRLAADRPKLNEIDHPGVAYEGVLVTVTRSRRVWELLNPAAPPTYGKFEDTIVRDPATGRMAGVKLFSIRF